MPLATSHSLSLILSTHFKDPITRIVPTIYTILCILFYLLGGPFPILLQPRFHFPSKHGKCLSHPPQLWTVCYNHFGLLSCSAPTHTQHEPVCQVLYQVLGSRGSLPPSGAYNLVKTWTQATPLATRRSWTRRCEKDSGRRGPPSWSLKEQKIDHWFPKPGVPTTPSTEVWGKKTAEL